LKTKLEREYRNEQCGVLKENWEILELWLRISNLFLYGPFGGVISLNWPAVLAKIQLLEKARGKSISLEMFEGIELMEQEALLILNEDIKNIKKDK
jgi:hypothetical protein